MQIDLQIARHVAKLARLALSDQELEAIALQLSAISNYVDSLGSLDVEGVSPTFSVEELWEGATSICTPLRSDHATDPLARALALHNAPESDGEAFLVPQVVGAKETT